MQWQIGQIIEARVVEKIAENVLIVSFAGDLLRVENQSRQKISIDQTVRLLVLSIEPLRFRLATDSFRGHPHWIA